MALPVGAMASCEGQGDQRWLRPHCSAPSWGQSWIELRSACSESGLVCRRQWARWVWGGWWACHSQRHLRRGRNDCWQSCAGYSSILSMRSGQLHRSHEWHWLLDSWAIFQRHFWILQILNFAKVLHYYRQISSTRYRFPKSPWGASLSCFSSTSETSALGGLGSTKSF